MTDQNNSLDHLIETAGRSAEASGWHDDAIPPGLDPSAHLAWVGSKVLLAISELTEAYEELRNNHAPSEVYAGKNGKPEGFPVEIADTFIRLGDLYWTLGKWYEMPELTEVIESKLEHNAKRGHKHGGRAI